MLAPEPLSVKPIALQRRSGLLKSPPASFSRRTPRKVVDAGSETQRTGLSRTSSLVASLAGS